MRRLRVEVQGAVQGVGFRPFLFRLATELGVVGWVLNDSQGVAVEVEGELVVLERFLQRLEQAPPPQARIVAIRREWLDPAGFERFEIRPSDPEQAPTVLVLPDVATCSACQSEVADPGDRRHRYPFTNCTDCGPRFSILRSLPYDRPRTTLSGFALCPDCLREYEDPLDRRFHAQPNACPACGPSLTLRTVAGESIAREDAALVQAVQALRAQSVVAIKGLGGFLLLVDAASEEAVALLRRRKGRPAKPLAVMVRDVAMAESLVHVSPAAAEHLRSGAAPILLLPRKLGAPIASGVAPDTDTLGVFLPYSPLHHLLLQGVDRPLVATSGNRSEEPLCTDEGEARVRLRGIPDLLLTHDRPIARPVDDSVAQLIGEELQLLRRARGFAPLPLTVGRALPPVLAVGAHQKGCVALSHGEHVFVSQHLGDLESPESRKAFHQAATDLLDLYGVEPQAVAHDLHPDYASTRWAEEAVGERGEHALLRDLPRIAVQHHHAHLAACLLENAFAGPALGVVWDGSGLGTDGSVWGGEFLKGDAAGVERVAHLRAFRLPGGDAAVREPRRSALALCWEEWAREPPQPIEDSLDSQFAAEERRVLLRLLEGGLRAPLTTSAGRLFDGVAALLGLHPRVSYEGQAAVALQALVDPTVRDAYPCPLAGHGAQRTLDWGPLLQALSADLAQGGAPERAAGRFHNALVEGIAGVADWIGLETIALSGGCFQNRLLTERARQRLETAGFRVLVHRRLPPNDGGLAAGQLAVAAAQLQAQASTQCVG